MNAPNLGTENPMTDKEILEAAKLAEDMKRFERAKGRGFDFGKCLDAWGRDKYVHSHIDAAFDGFLLGERTAITSMPHSEQVEAAAEAWRDVHAGMQRFGMESTDIETVADFFEALTRNVSDKE